ncbi:tetratricopeptide repeat protein [Hyphomicrobium sp. 99]|uniref:tetratricopeptide repeat protein n=1 Tax=Hyphomicrobium sp. 99 TaxID=1163419 RepID=UPI0005F83790|nr:tetratricopeptide repeat protein [Hyphomicrobium sp. 99]
MELDQQGLALTGATNNGAELFRSALDELVYFKSSVLSTLDKAIAEDPGFALPYFARAYLDLFMTEPKFAKHAKLTIDELKSKVDINKLPSRERHHAAAIEAWIEGDLRKSARILDQLGLDEPRDILALRIGHELDFFSGNKRSLRDRVARQLSAWTPSDAHYGIVQGCYAFGLEENGQYERAQEHGLIALSVRPDDVWALHAVTHSFEMRGAIADGLRFMSDRSNDWAEGNLFSAHNWWHKALFNTDIGDYATAFKIYDEAIFNQDSPKIALVLLDASSLLWRLHLLGVPVADRFAKLAAAWEALEPDPFYVFNDVHAVMAYIGSGRIADARAVVSRLERYVTSGRQDSNNYHNTIRVGLPLAKALVAFGEERYGTALELLYGVRENAIEFGGSEAQRDAIDRTLLEAAIRSGRANLANALASERINLNPHNPYNWSKMAEALRLSNAVERARESDTRSQALKAEVFQAVTPGHAQSGAPIGSPLQH